MCNLMLSLMSYVTVTRTLTARDRVCGKTGAEEPGVLVTPFQKGGNLWNCGQPFGPHLQNHGF